jgi:hypothetical protein
MNYWLHFKLNMRVAFKCGMLSLFHCIHAILPIDLTSHEYWKIEFGKNEHVE